MMGLETIRSENRTRCLEARRLDKEPFLIEEEGDKGFLSQIPHIGDYRPKGWKLVDTLFVDSSGLGSEGEPAMTFSQFVARSKLGFGYAIIEAGQFQVRIAGFRRLRA